MIIDKEFADKRAYKNCCEIEKFDLKLGEIEKFDLKLDRKV